MEFGRMVSVLNVLVKTNMIMKIIEHSFYELNYYLLINFYEILKFSIYKIKQKKKILTNIFL